MIGTLWFLTVLGACWVVAFGVLTDFWLRWMSQPWWWATTLAVFIVGLGRFLGQGNWLVGAFFVVGCGVAGFNLWKAIVARQRTAARHRRRQAIWDAWERL